MPLTEKEIAKIRQDAEALYPDYPQVRISTLGIVQSYHEAKRQGYIAGAIAAVTSERERAKVLVEAANDICEKLEPLLPESILSSIYKTLSNALKKLNHE